VGEKIYTAENIRQGGNRIRFYVRSFLETISATSTGVPIKLFGLYSVYDNSKHANKYL
jgi:hypothetical protein